MIILTYVRCDTDIDQYEYLTTTTIKHDNDAEYEVRENFEINKVADIFPALASIQRVYFEDCQMGGDVFDIDGLTESLEFILENLK